MRNLRLIEVIWLFTQITEIVDGRSVAAAAFIPIFFNIYVHDPS